MSKNLSRIGHLVIVEFNIKSFCVKIVSKNASEPGIAKYLISNLHQVAYKLFLYKNRIKTAIEAHWHGGSVALRHGEKISIFSRHFVSITPT